MGHIIIHVELWKDGPSGWGCDGHRGTGRSRNEVLKPNCYTVLASFTFSEFHNVIVRLMTTTSYNTAMQDPQ